MADIPVRRDYGGYHPSEYDTATTVPSLLKRVSWGAILAGSAVALGILVLMGLLGLAIGIGSINPGQEQNPMSGLGTGTVIWWVISSLVALFIGGRVAGQLAGFPSRTTALLHGLTVWALATFVSAWLASTAVSSIVGGAMSLISGAASRVGSVVGAVAPDSLPEADTQRLADQARQEVEDLTQQAGLTQADANAAQQVVEDTARDIVTSPGDIGQDIDTMIDQLFRGEGAVVSPAERDRLVAAVAERAGVTPAEAERTVDAWVAQTRDVSADVSQAIERGADDVTDTISAVAWGAFFTSLASMIAAIVGAATGAPKEPFMRARHETDEVHTA